MRTGRLDGQEGRKDLADLVGELGMPVDVLGHGRTLAPPVSFQELLGQHLHGIADRGQGRSSMSPGPAQPERWPRMPGPFRRIGLSRLSART